jgi:hypothetical protein
MICQDRISCGPDEGECVDQHECNPGVTGSTMWDSDALVGARVSVDVGRWAGRVGTVMQVYWSWTSPQPQAYPVVVLDAKGRARQRKVRVLAVTVLDED